MPKQRALGGTVFLSSTPLVDAAAPARRPYAPHDRVTWGIYAYTNIYACLVEDEAGIVLLGLGLASRDDAERYVLKTIARYWRNGAASVTRNDYHAAEVFAGAMQGRPYPLHMALTPFEERVLRAACTIPRGEVRTYGWIARQIGAPKASRAVANALHRNPVAIIVPCHRVVPSTGEVGGYACGTELKARILNAEGVKTLTNSLVLPAE